LSAFSVVVASFSGEEALARCLETLVPQGAEIVAATTAGPRALAGLEARFGGVRFLSAAPGTSVFRLRTLGLAETRGARVALTEDHCTVAPDWLASLQTAHERGHAIVGGPVENGLTGIYDWTLYLCEYGAFLPPVPDGPTRVLSGVNVSYAREALLSCRPSWSEAFRENEVHDALHMAGHSLYRCAAARVTSHLRLPLREAMAHLFAGGRHYGRYRMSRAVPLRRALLLAAMFAVPAWLFGRLALAVLERHPRRLVTLLLGLPYVACLLGAWSAGEAAGYLGSRAPDSGG
jgi:Glycosyl transferase family 2